jgi:hypothetical protein
MVALARPVFGAIVLPDRPLPHLADPANDVRGSTPASLKKVRKLQRPRA